MAFCTITLQNIYHEYYNTRTIKFIKKKFLYFVLTNKALFNLSERLNKLSNQLGKSGEFFLA